MTKIRTCGEGTATATEVNRLSFNVLSDITRLIGGRAYRLPPEDAIALLKSLRTARGILEDGGRP